MNPTKVEWYVDKRRTLVANQTVLQSSMPMKVQVEYTDVIMSLNNMWKCNFAIRFGLYLAEVYYSFSY